MRRLNAPSRDHLADYVKVMDHRTPQTRGALRSAQRRVLIAYDEYPRTFHFREPLDFGDENAAVSSALRSNYDHALRGGCLSSLRSEVISLASGRCPYCEISAATSIDHYLPRSAFPEFSILAANLIPLCADCNRLKGDFRPNAIRRYPHLYLDAPIQSVYLVATVENGAGIAVSYSMEWSAGICRELKSAIEFLVNDFDLLRRFSIEGAEELSAQLSSIRYVANFGAERLRTHFGWLAKGFADSFGLNHWRTALYRSIAIDDSWARSLIDG